MDIEIKPILLSEVKELRQLSIQTFGETFASSNLAEDMTAFYERAYNVKKLKAELQRENTWFYFARVEGEIVGYLMFNIGDDQTELGEEDGFEIERIYLLKKYYGVGIGSALMDFALKNAKELSKTYVWLGVYEENFRAQAFYRKYDFEEFDEHVFMMGNTPQRDVLMRLKLV